jgi:hypothetical protein
MKSKTNLTIAVALFSLLTLEAAQASSIRCGTHVLTAGMRNSPGQYEVLKRCGEPDVRLGNTWIYERGSVSRQITFSSNGQINTID